jgi:glutamate dehydrogenase
VLLAYAKITVGDDIRESHLVTSPYVRHLLHDYFPVAVRDRFPDAIDRHSLRREILATVLANTTVNRAGVSYVFRMSEETGAHAADVVAAHLVARDLFDMPRFWSGIEALDGVVDVGIQTALLLAARLLVERGARWLLRHRDVPLDPERVAHELRDGVAEVAASLPELLVGEERDRYEQTVDDLGRADVPRDVSVVAASLPPLGAALDVVVVARTSGRDLAEVAAVYLALGERLRLDRLRDRIAALPRRDRWQTGARSALRDELADERRALTADVLSSDGGVSPAARLDAWLERNPAALARYSEIDDEIEAAAEFDLTTLSVAVRELRELRTREEVNGSS